MDYWMRAATLQIGPKRYSLDELNFSFEVAFEDSTQLCTATIDAYNLSPSTRNGIKKNMPVIINAGYEGDIGVIFIGQVSSVEHNTKNVDIISNIKAAMSMEQWVSKQVNKTYKSGILAKEIVADLVNLFGVELGVEELVINKTYPRGKVCKGKLKDVLTEIITKDCKSRFLIKDNRIIINNPGQGIRTGYLLSTESGLLRASFDKDEQQITTNINSTTSSAEKSQSGQSRSCECLLNYHLGVADEVRIKSQKLNGNFIITKGKHIGSYDKDWKTIIEVKPA